MSRKHIVPCLDIRDGKVVKGVNFDGIREVADPVELARFYCDEGADELVFYDISASMENRGIFPELFKKIRNEVNIPLVVGGGVKSLEDFGKMLELGADKVSINSGQIVNPELIAEVSRSYPKEKIVFAMDAKKAGDSWHVFSKGGSQDTMIDAVDWAKKACNDGAGEIVINSIDNDGVKQGYDIDLLVEVAKVVDIPIVASGGAGKMEDFATALKIDGVGSALAASVFHFKEIRINELKKYLMENAIEVVL